MKTKKEFHYFTIFNHQKEESYLRKMHKSGWKFIKVDGIGMYHFEECVPEDVIYQLDYNKASQSNRDEYEKMFEDCGWEHIQNFVGYSYFRKPASDTNLNEEIFCDDESRIMMMQRVFKARLIPLLIMFLVIFLPIFVLSIKNGEYIISVMYGFIVVIYIIIFIICAYKYFNLKNNMK